jgi:hypothetical protein
MYQVYYTNFDYYAAPEFRTVDDALDYGKARGFEFAVHRCYRSEQPHNDTVVAAWNPITGTEQYVYLNVGGGDVN